MSEAARRLEAWLKAEGPEFKSWRDMAKYLTQRLAEVSRLQRELAAVRASNVKHVSECVSLTLQIENEKRETQRLRELIAQAQPVVCSMQCPSVKKEGVAWRHESLCNQLTAAARPWEEADGKNAG